MCYNTKVMEEYEQVNECILRIKAGDLSAIDPLHTLIGMRLHFVALRYFDVEELQEDAVQDFWLNIEKYCRKFRFVGNGVAYLTKVFKHQCLMRVRQENKRRGEIPLSCLCETLDRLGTDEEADFHAEALRQSFAKAQIGMTERERAVLACLLYDTSVRDIADMVGTSKSTAARLRTRVLDILQESLRKDGWL